MLRLPFLKAPKPFNALGDGQPVMLMKHTTKQSNNEPPRCEVRQDCLSQRYCWCRVFFFFFATLWPKACLESKSARHTDLTVTDTAEAITPGYLVCSPQRKHKVHVPAHAAAPLSPGCGTCLD